MANNNNWVVQYLLFILTVIGTYIITETINPNGLLSPYAQPIGLGLLVIGLILAFLEIIKSEVRNAIKETSEVSG